MYKDSLNDSVQLVGKDRVCSLVSFLDALIDKYDTFHNNWSSKQSNYLYLGFTEICQGLCAHLWSWSSLNLECFFFKHGSWFIVGLHWLLAGPIRYLVDHLGPARIQILAGHSRFFGTSTKTSFELTLIAIPKYFMF